MKKTKLTLGLMTGLLCIGGLAACNETSYNPQGYILTYTLSDGSTVNYTADDLFKSYYSEAEKTSTMFDSVYKLIVKNYFTLEEHQEELKSIKELASRDVDGDKQQATKNADTKGTSYDTEFNAILSSHNCTKESELLEYYIYERELSTFEDNFYDNNIGVLRDGGKVGNVDFNGYIKTLAPYHVSHILVKIDDSSSTNYWNATISEQDCYDLAKVTANLAEGRNSFGYIANLYSDDTGSKASFGDLGIMDKNTSFVDEFKLGVYAYENLYGANKQMASAENSAIKMFNPSEYQKYDGSKEGKVATIPYSIFELLGSDDVAKTTKGYNNSSVNSDSATYYPRNIFFNEYLNKHSVSLISDKDLKGNTIDTTNLKGFHTLFTNDTTKYLCAETKYTKADGTIVSEYKPILVSRAGTSDYQGIHFIVVNRSPFETAEDLNGVNLSNYYTTYFPGQKEYPTRTITVGGVDTVVDLQTYVNFNNLEEADAKSRADSLKGSIKGYDTNISKSIYRSYKESGKVKILDEDLDAKIEKWIDVTLTKKTYDEKLSWEKTWTNYINNLQQQKNESTKRLAKVCAIGYKKINGPEGDQIISAEEAAELEERYNKDFSDYTYNKLFNEIGAPCNDGQKH